MAKKKKKFEHSCEKGEHTCIRCLGTASCREYFDYDHVCAYCAMRDDFPHASDSHFEQFCPADRLKKETV